ncbi:pilus assembly protein [Pandoraea vervacti]|uniref:Pilus assembly protein n=1 Tax=Pandoraea vervacti TaxID=656178 RepID=A0ABN4FQ81_9BURK|nr:Flp family type IVb pilin [Pandoraea vervacti]AJP57857.1 pilus assembly protein [Pandoraea vervacti]
MQANRARNGGRPRSGSRQEGVTALEYGILAAIVAVIIGGTVYTNLSGALTSAFASMTSAVSSAISH